MATWNVYCKKNNDPKLELTDIWVKNGDYEHPDLGWFSTAMESDPAHDLIVSEGDWVIFQLIPNSGIDRLDTITSNPPGFFQMLPPTTIDGRTAIQALVNRLPPPGPVDYIIWYHLPDDSEDYSHDPKIRINNK